MVVSIGETCGTRADAPEITAVRLLETLYCLGRAYWGREDEILRHAQDLWDRLPPERQERMLRAIPGLRGCLDRRVPT